MFDLRGVWLLIDEEGLEETQQRAHQDHKREEECNYLVLPPSSAAPRRAREGQAEKNRGGHSTCVGVPTPSSHWRHSHEGRKHRST